MMADVIEQAIYSIEEIIKSVSHTSTISIEYPQLIALNDEFNKLVESFSSIDDFMRLFCRRLKRLMKYNTGDIKSQCQFWNDIYEDLLYVLYGPDVRQNKHNWERFLARMELESKLEQRESQFVMNVGNRKSLFQLLWIHRNILDEYLQNCIGFHSKVQMRDMIDNIDDLLYYTYGQRDISLTLESRVRLQEKLKSIEISFDCSNVLVQISNSKSSVYNQSHKRNDDNIDRFLPSTRRAEKAVSSVSIHKMTTILELYRWVVILGDPGSSKTTLLRWITRVYAEAILRGDDKSLVRIPILIRISEFAEWLNQYPNLTLMDYIGKHTWFSQPYNHNGIGNVLKELIYHGHALILLDGLNQILISTKRREIIKLVKNFIDDYVRAPNFLSPFDDAPFNIDTLSNWDKYIFQNEISLPKKSIGNQIILTSDIVGYDLCPFNSLCIQHVFFNLMNIEEASQFANQWVKQVEQSLRFILLDEGIHLDEIRQDTLIKRVDNIIDMIYIDETNLINPLMISLFCMHIFTSSDPKSAMEVYEYGVQSILRAWRRLECNISETILIEFFTDLAAYLHFQSPSDLIDEFDIKKLCYLVLKRLKVSNNRKELEEYRNKLISLLDSNIGIVVDRSLQIFRFIHFSIQRYFVIQFLIRESPIESIVRRFFKFINERRFYKSLLMAVGWINLKWSLNNSNHFFDLLISYPTEDILPVGTLLFFDAFKYIQNLPSKEIIFKGFNNLLDHPSNLISNQYLTSSQLPVELIVEWIKLNITNEKRLFNFCRCLSYRPCQAFGKAQLNTLSKVSPSIFQQLWLLRSISQSAELIIDQTLHQIMKFYQGPDHIFENEFYSYFLLKTSDSFKIHPLILSVILVLCGGLYFTVKEDILTIKFSPKRMHRQSSMIGPIIEYLINIEQPHLIKIKILIEKYENILEKCSSKDISPDIIDTFIALICLRGLSNPSMYDKFAEYEALSLVLERFKQILLYLKDLYNSYRSISTSQCIVLSEIESIINQFFNHPNQSDQKLITFSFACIAAWKKLSLNCLGYFVNFDVIRKSNINQYLEVQFEYRHYIRSEEQDNNILEMREYTPFDLLLFIPQSLQQLFYRLIISSIDKSQCLPLILLLSECLMRLENIKYYRTNHYYALWLLYPLCKEHQLENYCSILFWDKSNSSNKVYRERFLQRIKTRELPDRFPNDVSKEWQVLINEERKRINEAIHGIQDEKKKDFHLFSACLSLGRLFQGHYCSLKGKYPKDNIPIFTSESDEIYIAIEYIRDPILQLIVLNMILRLEKPCIFPEEQINRLNRKVILLLNDLLSNLPLLSLTYLFVQFYDRLQSFPNFVQQFTKIIGNKFNQNPIDKQNQESAYVALRMLNENNLKYYLSKFEKETTNLSSLLHFNSITFFDYFSSNSSFITSDITLLSSMYLIELSVDVQLLEMYTNKNSMKTISPLEELDQLWKDPLQYKQIMTNQVATWITHYLKSSKREYIEQIIERVSSCYIIEQNANEIIHTWCDYRTDKHLKFFAYYAALFSIEDNSIEILKQMFDTHDYLHLESIIKSLLEFESVTSNFLCNILTPIIQGAQRICMHTLACIRSKQILDLLLTMECKRIITKEYKSSQLPNRSFLSVVQSCSDNLQDYLMDHLQHFNINNQFENDIKQQYLITILKWIILESLNINNRQNLSIKVYTCFIRFLHDERIPLVQTIIANGINAILISDKANKGHVFVKDDLKKQLEEVIDKTNISREDLLSACLLAYGNCLLTFKYIKMDENLSIEMQNLLDRICLMSSSEIVSTRAHLCLLFSKNWKITDGYTFDCLKNDFDFPIEKRYNVLFQLTLYRHPIVKIDLVKPEIRDHIQKYSSTLLVKFLIDSYKDFCDKDSEEIFSNYSLDYVYIGQSLLSANYRMFSDALQKTSFGEQKFKTGIFHASKKKDRRMCLIYYARFGEITQEFVEILANFEDVDTSIPWNSYFPKIKNVEDRDVIESLFELFRLKFCSKSKFSIEILELLVYLAQENIISALDVYHQVSIVTNNGLYQYDKTVFEGRYDPFVSLSKLRKFAGETGWSEEGQFLTMENIQENFTKTIQHADKYSALFLRDELVSPDMNI